MDIKKLCLMLATTASLCAFGQVHEFPSMPHSSSGTFGRPINTIPQVPSGSSIGNTLSTPDIGSNGDTYGSYSTGSFHSSTGSSTGSTGELHTPRIETHIPSYGRLHYQTVRIQFRRESVASHFALFLGNRKSSPLYQGNDITSLMKALNKSTPIPKGGQYYVILQGFSTHRARNMLTNMRIQQNQIDPSVSVQPIPHQGRWEKALVHRRVTDLTVSTAIKPMTSRRGWFEATLKITQRTANTMRTVRLKVQAASRSLVESFINVLRNKFPTLLPAHKLSVVEIVSATRSELKKSFKVSDKQLRTIVIDQTGTSFIVLLLENAYNG